MNGYAFRRALRYRAKTWHGVGDGPTRFVEMFSKRPHQRSKVIQRSSYFRNILWPRNLVGRTPDRSVVHSWGQRSCRGQPGSIRAQITQECPMATEFGRTTPDRSVTAGVEGHVGSDGDQIA